MHNISSVLGGNFVARKPAVEEQANYTTYVSCFSFVPVGTLYSAPTCKIAANRSRERYEPKYDYD